MTFESDGIIYQCEDDTCPSYTSCFVKSLPKDCVECFSIKSIGFIGGDSDE